MTRSDVGTKRSSGGTLWLEVFVVENDSHQIPARPSCLEHAVTKDLRFCKVPEGKG